MFNLVDSVHQYFDSLANYHGLRCVISTEKIVRFENEKVFLQIQFDVGKSYEVSVQIGQCFISLDQVQISFNLAELLRLRASEDTKFVERLQIIKPDFLIKAIERLSVIVEKYAARLLDGCDADFNELASFRKKECADYALSNKLKHAKKNAEEAWSCKDYGTVIAVYKPIETFLSLAEKKKLAFAKKQVDRSANN
jgi:hypothetical protein